MSDGHTGISPCSKAAICEDAAQAGEKEDDSQDAAQPEVKDDDSEDASQSEENDDSEDSTQSEEEEEIEVSARDELPEGGFIDEAGRRVHWGGHFYRCKRGRVLGIFSTQERRGHHRDVNRLQGQDQPNSGKESGGKSGGKGKGQGTHHSKHRFA